MSVAVWYYCNLIDDTEASDVVPVVQIRQSAVQVDPKTSRPTASLVLGAVVDDELAVGRSTYVLTASLAAMLATIESETVKAETAVPVVSPVEKIVAHPATVDKEVQETKQVNEVPTGMVITVVKEEVVDVIAAQDEKLVSIDRVTHDPVDMAEMVTEAAAASDVLAPAPEEKVEDVMVIAESTKLSTRTALFPKDNEKCVGAAEESAKGDHVDEPIDAASMKKTVEIVAAVEASGDESENEMQSEISEALTIETMDASFAAKVNEMPESEIEETMVIDPEVAAMEAAATEAQTCSFSFIPEQIRNNSYAVSSVAVAVATAIAATLVARR